MNLFQVDDPENCPITNCSLRQPDCKFEYNDGIFVDKKSPYGVFSINNFPAGWSDPLCLVCQNKDEVVSVRIEVAQRNCLESKNCPLKVNVTRAALEKEQCKGTLTPVINPKSSKIVIPFANTKNQLYTRVDA